MPIANANVNLPSFHSSSEIAITKMEIQQRRLKWATRLEEVLNDFDGLQLFQSWMGVDEDSSEHPLRLHFAIVAYREMLAKADPRAVQLAREIYNKFLRARSGLCAFIEPAVRERVGQRLRQHTSGSCPPAELFDECLPPLDTFLRRQHALFVSSHEFLDKLNAGFGPPDSGPSCSSASVQNTPAHSSRRQQLRPTALTADTLLRSQREREAMVPTGTASQRLFKPVSRFPYVGQAQPSKNDSAVSSSFSSEANRARGGGGGAGGSYSLRMVRDEQKRINPQLMATFPRLDHGSAIRVETSQSANQFRHDSDEGRHQFAEQLQRKLQTLQLRHRQEESVKEQIERINSARQKGTKQSARELIAASAAGANDSLLALGMDDSAAGADADEELETYYRQKMATGQDSNSSAANSAGQTPPLVPLSRRTRRRSSRGDNGSCSPLALDRMQPLTFDWAGPASFATAGSPPAAMSQSCCSGQPGSSATAASGWGAHFGGGHFPLLESTERAFFIAPVSGQHQQQPPPFATTFGGFGHPQQQQAIPAPNFCLGQSTPMATATTPRPTVGLLSQSLHLAGTSAIPQQSKMATQPPPFIASKCQNNPTNCDNDGDTSGIGSMTSATHSGTSAPGTAEQRERQRAAVFRKARLSAGSGATSAAAGTGGGCSQQQSAIPRQQQQPKRPPDQQQFDSLIRPRAALPPQQPQLQAQQGQGGTMMKMAISYRDNGADGVPVMAQIPLRPLTFREFRRILSISSKDHRQFFFKTASEDGSAPYQLLLVNDDSAILPMFCGKIVAECRAPLSDSD